MSSEELRTNVFRITQTEAKLIKNKINTEKDANNTHYEVRKKIRNTIKELKGTIPKDLPTPKRSLKEIEKKEIE